MKSTFLRSLAVCVLLEAVCALTLPSGATASSASAIEGATQEDTRALPMGVRAEQVTFSNNGLKLSGRLLIPKLAAGKRAPALLLVSGSNLRAAGLVTIAAAPVGAFADLAAAMSGNGMAVLSFDTECNGASECKRDASPQDYATDAIAAFQYLAKRPEVDASKIVVLGHDEGGCFAAAVAGNPSQGTKLLGVIFVNVPGRTYGKLIRDHAAKRLAAAGKTPDEVKTYLQQFDILANMLSSGSDNFKLAKLDEKDPLFSQFVKHRQYLFHLFVNDPLQLARSIEVPILIVQGAKDAQVGVRDAQYLKESVDRQYHKDATIEILPEMDHWMREQKASVPYRDEESNGALDPELTKLLNAWISKRLR